MVMGRYKMLKYQSSNNWRIFKKHVKDNIYKFVFLGILIVIYALFIIFCGDLQYTLDVALGMIPLLSFHACIKEEKYSDSITGIIIITLTVFIFLYKLKTIDLAKIDKLNFILEYVLLVGLIYILTGIINSAKKVDDDISRNTSKNRKKRRKK